MQLVNFLFGNIIIIIIMILNSPNYKKTSPKFPAIRFFPWLGVTGWMRRDIRDSIAS